MVQKNLPVLCCLLKYIFSKVVEIVKYLRFCLCLFLLLSHFIIVLLLILVMWRTERCVKPMPGIALTH